jgi:hypothetical protein
VLFSEKFWPSRAVTIGRQYLVQIKGSRLKAVRLRKLWQYNVLLTRFTFVASFVVSLPCAAARVKYL